MHRSTRRRFLWIIGSASIPIGWHHGLLPSISHQSATGAEPNALPSKAAEHLITRSGYALGTTVSLSIVHADQQVANRAMQAAFGQLHLIESLCSLYRPDSQICQLNRSGYLNQPHPLLLDVLRQAQEMSRRSNGAFDISVQPLWSLFASAQQDGGLPGLKQIEETRRLVNWQHVEIDSQRIRLCGKGMAVTLNGIAQGFAADRLRATLAEHGVRQALIDTGEFAACGSKSATAAWRVGVQHPRHQEAYASVVALSERCLATSGDYATTFSPDFRHHHLFDPRTGQSPGELASVSIAAPSATWADALSTATFVLGPVAGLNLIKAEPHCDALLVLKDGSSISTENFPRAS